MFLLLNDGKIHQEIADFIGCSLRTVAYWFRHGDPSNLDSLQDGRSKGNYKKVTPEYIKLLLEIIDKEPKELGYEFGRWTAARLAEHLEKETKISLSSSRIRRILKKINMCISGRNLVWKTNKIKKNEKNLKSS